MRLGILARAVLVVHMSFSDTRASSTSLTAEASDWQVMKEMSSPVTRSRTSSLVFLEAWPINQPSHRGSRPHPCETRRVSRIRIWRQTRAQEEEGITLCLVAHLRGTYPYSHFLGSRKKSFGKTLKSSKLWTSLITLRSYQDLSLILGEVRFHILDS